MNNHIKKNIQSQCRLRDCVMSPILDTQEKINVSLKVISTQYFKTLFILVSFRLLTNHKLIDYNNIRKWMPIRRSL